MKTSDQNMGMRADIQECIRQKAKHGFKVVSRRFKRGKQDKKQKA